MASSTPQSPRPASSSRTLARGFSSAPFSRSQRAKPLEELTELSVPEPSCHPVWHTELRKSYFFSDFHGNRNLPRLMKPSNLFCCRPLQPVALSRSSGRTKAGPKSRNTTADQHRRWRAMVIYKWTNKENHPTPRCTQQLYVDNVYTGFLCSLPAVAESKIFLSVRLEVAQNAWLSLASSKFHIQSPLKKKTYWCLLSDMGYDVSFNTLLFFWGDKIDLGFYWKVGICISDLSYKPKHSTSWDIFAPGLPRFRHTADAKLVPNFVQNLTFDPVGALKMLSLQKRLVDLFVWRKTRWQSGGCSRWKAAKHVMKENNYRYIYIYTHVYVHKYVYTYI